MVEGASISADLKNASVEMPTATNNVSVYIFGGKSIVVMLQK